MTGKLSKSQIHQHLYYKHLSWSND